ncbi:sensor histidine kinase [Auraticoccus monumenti]|uniref:histidine kinase n=1 Tax=Auraticoccus monumenti TaxID=675864 RepID=A0A1G7EL04_9ACTN|nr:HAMP domain-containing sensor histidine kinase [Auraticoccus monumenti]SDE64349.1 two-component system, OmpR family, sensor histidine kinase VanS [Auraticoccus monumenti]
MPREPGPSVRLRLTLSYAGFLLVTGVGLIAVVWFFLLRYVPERAVVLPGDVDGDPTRPGGPGVFIPGRADLWEAFAPKATLMLGLLLVVGLVGGWLLAGRVLAPLDRIAEATRTAGSGALSHRIRLPGRNDEFRELADAFDGMLARLEAHVAEQQRFAANASHELRTPLAITQTLLDVASRDRDRDTDALLRRLRLVNSRAIELTEALLLLSRADQRPAPDELVDLSLAAEEAAETLLPLAEARGVLLETSGDPAPTTGSAALLLQLTTNLVHNAIVHNVGAGGVVRVTTTASAGNAELTVENTGPVLGPEHVATFTEPFQRGSARVRSDHAGVGLGLAIVERITSAHGGTLDLAPRPAGGLRVTVRLPAPAPAAAPARS